jgi:prevent-host-death family protein
MNKENKIMSIVNATNFRKNIYDYLDGTIEANDIVTVTTKGGNAVLISEEEYKSLVETAYINGIPGLAEDIIQGAKTPTNKLTKVDWENELRD